MQSELDEYLGHLREGLGHSARETGLVDYCRALMLPLKRKSVEPLAASVDPRHVSAKHQSLHHFVAQSSWSERGLLARALDWVVPKMDSAGGVYWIVDDTGMPKKGKHSVGVARQYCGQLGKQDNCQVAVSVSLATASASIPVAWQLYLPKSWAGDAPRRRRAGVPAQVVFQTKPAIALAQLRDACERDLPRGVVLADAGYGNDHAFREGVSALGLRYVAGVGPTTSVWGPGVEPLAPKAYCGRGIRPTRLRYAPGHAPVSVKALALELAPSAYRTVGWREGTNTELRSRFAAVRVRAAHRDQLRRERREPQWLLIEWPAGEVEPTKYWLSTLTETTSRKALVYTAKMRWRIERDYRELKQELGLGHYEGRGWRGFHHHATLCIAAYGFLVAHRLTHPGSKKNRKIRQAPALPEDYVPRGAPARAAPCR